MQTLYQKLLEGVDKPFESDEHHELLGAGTEYEAVSRTFYSEHSERWEGFIVFKDNRYSPPDPDAPMIEQRWDCPGGGNGVLAEVRNRNHWEMMVKMFKDLQGQS